MVRDRQFTRILKSRRWRAADAEVVLAAWQASGESVSGFARRHGLDAWRLMRWRVRLSKTTAIQFHRVKVAKTAEEVASGVGVELVLGGGRRIAVHRGFDATVLAELVRTVESW
jgi:hypothetical protein